MCPARQAYTVAFTCCGSINSLVRSDNHRLSGRCTYRPDLLIQYSLLNFVCCSFLALHNTITPPCLGPQIMRCPPSRACPLANFDAVYVTWKAGFEVLLGPTVRPIQRRLLHRSGLAYIHHYTITWNSVPGSAAPTDKKASSLPQSRSWHARLAMLFTQGFP